MRALLYGDLPKSTDTGFSLLCEEACEEAGPWSATRGDYFLCADDLPVICGTCESPMVLVQERRKFVVIDPDTRKAVSR